MSKADFTVYGLDNLRAAHRWLLSQPPSQERSMLESILCDLRAKASKSEAPPKPDRPQTVVIKEGSYP